MLVSILHRASGSTMALAGLPLLLWWLGALAAGPDAYATFAAWVWPGFGALEWGGGDILPSILKVILMLAVIAVSWAFFNHLASGVRHFVLDIGAGYELDGNRMWSIATPVIGLILFAAFWAAILL